MSTLGRLASSAINLIPIYFVAIIGLLGTVYIFNSNYEAVVETEDKQYNWNGQDIAIGDEEEGKELFDVLGVRQVDRVLSFQLNDPNPEATYEINFGDGNCVEMHQQSIDYIYKDTGRYEVELWVTHYGVSRQIDFQQIAIDMFRP